MFAQIRLTHKNRHAINATIFFTYMLRLHFFSSPSYFFAAALLYILPRYFFFSYALLLFTVHRDYFLIFDASIYYIFISPFFFLIFISLMPLRFFSYFSPLSLRWSYLLVSCFIILFILLFIYFAHLYYFTLSSFDISFHDTLPMISPFSPMICAIFALYAPCFVAFMPVYAMLMMIFRRHAFICCHMRMLRASGVATLC